MIFGPVAASYTQRRIRPATYPAEIFSPLGHRAGAVSVEALKHLLGGHLGPVDAVVVVVLLLRPLDGIPGGVDGPVVLGRRSRAADERSSSVAARVRRRATRGAARVAALEERAHLLAGFAVSRRHQ